MRLHKNSINISYFLTSDRSPKNKKIPQHSDTVSESLRYYLLKKQRSMFGHNQPVQFSIRQLHILVIRMLMVRRGIVPHDDKPRISVIV